VKNIDAPKCIDLSSVEARPARGPAALLRISR